MTTPVTRLQMVLKLAMLARDKFITETEEDRQLLEMMTFSYYDNMLYDTLSKAYEEEFQPVSNY
jgi:hypothetical protein